MALCVFSATRRCSAARAHDSPSATTTTPSTQPTGELQPQGGTQSLPTIEWDFLSTTTIVTTGPDGGDTDARAAVGNKFVVQLNPNGDTSAGSTNVILPACVPTVAGATRWLLNYHTTFTATISGATSMSIPAGGNLLVMCSGTAWTSLM